MAIYSLHHSSVGRSTHKPGTAAAHLRYISRRSACSIMLGEVPQGIELERMSLSTWLHLCEAADRANARVIDKLVVAIPVELSNEQRRSLVENFCKTVTLDKVPWIAAIHQDGQDARNPHAHIIIRDRDHVSGSRQIQTSSKGSTEKFRLAWEYAANEALQSASLDVRIDRRSHAQRGMETAPTVHLGAASKLEQKGLATVKGRLNRKILTANAVLREASRIAREAEAALEDTLEVEPMTLASSDDHTAGESIHDCKARNELERIWTKTRCKDGVRYDNRTGSFFDDGKSIRSSTGNEAEIQGMLLLAQAKGWKTIVTTGPPEFQRRVERAATAAGIEIYKPKSREATALIERLRHNTGRPGRERTR